MSTQNPSDENYSQEKLARHYREELEEQITPQPQKIVLYGKSSPFPPPDDLLAYTEIDPDLPSRLVAFTEEEQNHRHEMERRLLEAQIEDDRSERRERRLGQYLGFGIGIAAILGACYCARVDQPFPASFLGGSGVVGLVAVFVTGRRTKNRKEEGTD